MVERRKEQKMAKMKKAEVKPFKEMLIQLRARLRGDVSTLANTALSSSGGGGTGSSAVPSHMADMGSDTFEQDNTILLMNSEGETLVAIEAALERIEEGVYGSCLECSGKIPKMRLKAIPYTPHCVKCASELEDDKY
jgi:DnaK suppressor protein